VCGGIEGRMNSFRKRLIAGATCLPTCWIALVAILARPPVVLAMSCAGDCDGDGVVAIDELVTSVNIALGGAALSVCSGANGDDDGQVTVDELVVAVSNALNGCPIPATLTPTVTLPPTTTPTAEAVNGVPTEPAALLRWLQAGSYLDWAAASGRHPSLGPHTSTVRTFLNDTAIASLEAGNSSHPVGTALVKELYGSSPTVVGWAVMVKVQTDSDGGRGWYWYEGASLSGTGLRVCTGCHGSDYRGLTSRDFVLTPYPLQ
jgi:hypothetical protein